MSIKRPPASAGVLMLGLVAGCMFREVPLAGPDGAPSVSLDLDGWETVRSQHFILHTDAGLGAIQSSIRRFEETYEALKATFFEGVEVTAVEALVFGDTAEYDAVAGRGSAGKFFPGLGSTGSLLIVRHSESPEMLEAVVAHELAHRFVDAAHPALPNWLDEGIASYLESVDVRGDEVRFGAATRRSFHGFSTAGGVSFSALVQATPQRMYGNEASFFYSAAWALVHFLVNGRGGALRPRFGQLLVAVEDATRRGQSAEAAFTGVYPDVTATELDQAIERLTRSLGRPSVDVILSMPFQRPPAGSMERRPAEEPNLRALVAAVQRRNRRPAPEPLVDLAERPRIFRADAQLSFDGARYLGLSYGRMFRAPFAWGVDLGIGSLGYQLAGLVRGHVVAGQGGNFFVSAAFGPMVAIKSNWLGNEILPTGEANGGGHHFYFLGLHPEIAAEVRTPSNVLARVSVGAYFRIAENLTPACVPPVRPGEEPRCPAGQVGTRIARDGRDVFARVGLGYSW